MNLEVANRLQQLRKAKGLSQEELANILGLSRQAISKWERAETSPDTDNLICLARLYNISIDKLLDTSESTEEIKERIAQERIKDVTDKNEEIVYAIEEEHDEKTSEDLYEMGEEADIEGKKDYDNDDIVNVELSEEEKELNQSRQDRAENLWLLIVILGVGAYIAIGNLYNDWSWGWQCIPIGIFGGYFIMQLFINKTYAGYSFAITIAFVAWLLYEPIEEELGIDAGKTLAYSFLGLVAFYSLISIIIYIIFTLKNRKDIEILNEKGRLIELQEKCQKIVEINEKYKEDLKNINK